APIKLQAEDKMTQMSQSGQFPPYTWANAVDPRDKAGFAVEAMKFDGDLPAGQERRVRRFLAVGTSPAQALGILLEKAGGAGKISLTLRDTHGKPVATAAVDVVNGDKE